MEKQNLTQKDALEMLKNMNIIYSEQTLVFHVQEQNYNNVELLLIAGINPNTPFMDEKNFGHYAVHKAVNNNDIKMIELLIAYGVDINKKLNSGATALMVAANTNKQDALKFLIEKGADVNNKNADGLNALYYAKRNNNSEVINILKEGGAKEIKEEEQKNIETKIKSEEKKTITKKVVSMVVGLALCIGFVQWCNNHKSHSSGSNSGATYASNHKCTWCGKQYNGAGYHHIGTRCEVASNGWEKYDNNCSMQCCESAWKNGKH